MKKGLKLLFGTLLGFCAVGGTCVVADCVSFSNAPVIALAEGEPSEETSQETSQSEQEEEIFECSVVVASTEHGEISVDIEKGHVGDVVTVTAKHDMFYLVDHVSVNGTNLVEDEEISGKFSFALVEGENKIEAKFIVDAQLLGEMSTIYDQIANKDWTNLFSLENVVRIVSFVLNGGLLIAMVRYFIKDKRIAKNVESSVKESVEKIVPESTKQTVIAAIQDVLAPIFAELKSEQGELAQAMSVFAKCMALSQENTPEARRAILDELSTLKIGDATTIEDAKKQIEEFMSKKVAEMTALLERIDSIKETHSEKPEEIELAKPSNNGDDGTQI